MKLSRFNMLEEIDGAQVLYNTFTDGMVEIDDEFKLHLLNEDYSKIGDDELAVLKECGFVVEDHVDEMNLLKMRYNRRQYQSHEFSLTIAPTLECNFGCAYCYEPRKKGFISNEVREDIYKFLDGRLAGIKDTLNITWFGGEPLLYPNVIKEMTPRLKEITSHHNIKYSAYMITNGYLINKLDSSFFTDNHIKGIQVTLDGEKEIHDKKRILTGGGNTYDKILENIQTIDRSQLEVTIRINIDKENIEGLENILKALSAHGLSDCYITLGHIQSYTEECKCIEDFCISRDDYYKELVRFDDLLEFYGFVTKKVKSYQKSIYCGAVMDNTLTVDPNGYGYKCWNNIGREEQAVLKLDGDVSMSMYKNESEYLTLSPFEHEKCRTCKMLPVCMGGCPYYSKDGTIICDDLTSQLVNHIKNERGHQQ